MWTGKTTFFEKNDYPQIYEEEESQDCRQPKGFDAPNEPSEQERLLHELSHLPFRAWCPVCLKSKSKDSPHRQVYDKRPTIQMDYALLTDQGKEVTVLTAIDITTGLTSSSIVESKGVNDYAVAEMRRFIFETGRSKSVLQTDNEPAMKALAMAVAEATGVSVRHSPVYSSQSQGSVERFHSTLWQQTRTLMESMRVNYGVPISVELPVVTWLVRHVSWLCNRYLVHSGGKTSYERRWGRTYRRPICSFAEKVAYLKPQRGDKANPSCDYGIWLCKRTSSEEHLIGTVGGVKRGRSIRRLPPSQRYDCELPNSFRSLPWTARGPVEARPFDAILGPPPAMPADALGPAPGPPVDAEAPPVGEDEPDLVDGPPVDGDVSVDVRGAGGAPPVRPR